MAAGRVLLSTAVRSGTGPRKHRQQATLSFSVARKIRFQSSEMAAGQCAESVTVCLCGGSSSSTVVCWQSLPGTRTWQFSEFVMILI